MFWLHPTIPLPQIIGNIKIPTCFDPWMVTNNIPMPTFMKLGECWKGMNIWAMVNIERIFCLAKTGSPENDVLLGIPANWTHSSFHVPMDDEIDHHIIFVMDFCHAFRLGQDANLKHLNNLLFIPLTKCLQTYTIFHSYIIINTNNKEQINTRCWML